MVTSKEYLRHILDELYFLSLRRMNFSNMSS